MLDRYEKEFQDRKISLNEIIRYRRLFATDEERKRMNQEDTAREEREKEKRKSKELKTEKFVPKCPTCQSPNIKK